MVLRISGLEGLIIPRKSSTVTLTYPHVCIVRYTLCLANLQCTLSVRMQRCVEEGLSAGLTQERTSVPVLQNVPQKTVLQSTMRILGVRHIAWLLSIC